jgi:hypothetical protein
MRSLEPLLHLLIECSFSINVFINKNGIPCQIAFADIGDRIKIDSTRINRNNIFVYTIGREGNPLAYHFLFRNDSLITITK